MYMCIRVYMCVFFVLGREIARVFFVHFHLKKVLRYFAPSYLCTSESVSMLCVCSVCVGVYVCVRILLFNREKTGKRQI